MINSKIIKTISVYTGLVFALLIYYVSYNADKLGLPFSYQDFCCIDDRKLNLFLILIPASVFFVLSSYLSRTFVKFGVFTAIYLFIYLFHCTNSSKWLYLVSKRNSVFFGHHSIFGYFSCCSASRLYKEPSIIYV